MGAPAAASIGQNQVMAAPRFTPVSPVASFRDSSELPASLAWSPNRPADTVGRQARGARLGVPGPNQGYILKLTKRFHDRVVLAPREDLHDVEAGAVAVALKRASLFGRAPISSDLEVAYGAFGFLQPNADAEFVERRRALFAGASHSYDVQRGVADAVAETTLRMSSSGVTSAASRGDWTDLVTL